MKFKGILFAVCILINAVYYQSIAKEINSIYLPKEVKVKFQSLYSQNIEGINWQKRFNKYQADFNLNNKSISLIFNKKGNLLNERIEIDIMDVPSLVFQKIKKSYLDKDYKILYIIRKSEWRKDFSEGKRDFFEVEVMKGRLMYIIRYSKEGKVLNIFGLNKRAILDERWVEKFDYLP